MWTAATESPCKTSDFFFFLFFCIFSFRWKKVTSTNQRLGGKNGRPKVYREYFRSSFLFPMFFLIDFFMILLAVLTFSKALSGHNLGLNGPEKARVQRPSIQIRGLSLRGIRYLNRTMSIRPVWIWVQRPLKRPFHSGQMFKLRVCLRMELG